MGYKLYEIIFLFSFYSFIGRIICILASSLKKDGYTNKGICKGPCQPAFGAGAVLLILIGRIIEPNPINMFISGAAVGTLIELTSMVFVHKFTGKTNKIKWFHPVLFGLGAVLLVLDVNVMVEAILSVTNPLILLVLLFVFWMFFPSDLIDGITMNIMKKNEYNE